MSIGREESLFLTVSEDHRKRTYPEYVQKMSEPFERAGGMVEVYEGVVLGGADKFFGLDDLNLWLRRHRYAAYDMDVLLPIAHLCVERAVRARLMASARRRRDGREQGGRARFCVATSCATGAARAAGCTFTI